MFRHLMVDVIVNSSHGVRLGAVRKWASGGDDILSTAIHDFPILGVIVRRTHLFHQICINAISYSVALFLIGPGASFLISQLTDGGFCATRTK